MNKIGIPEIDFFSASAEMDATPPSIKGTYLNQFKQEHATLYHGTTSFGDRQTASSLCATFGIHSQKIYASHDRRVAATYAAVIKYHPHMDAIMPGMEGPVSFLVIDDKNTYLESLKLKNKFLLSVESEEFQPVSFGIRSIAEWESLQGKTIKVKDVHEYAGFKEILNEGVQIFFTQNTNHEKIRAAYKSAMLPDLTIKKFVNLGFLEWANKERGIKPAPEFF